VLPWFGPAELLLGGLLGLVLLLRRLNRLALERFEPDGTQPHQCDD